MSDVVYTILFFAFFITWSRYSGLPHIRAASISSGLPRFGSPRSDWMESKIERTSYRADHCSLRMSKHISPLAWMFGWKQWFRNLTVGGLNGYFGPKVIVILYVRFSNTVSFGPSMVATQLKVCKNLETNHNIENKYPPEEIFTIRKSRHGLVFGHHQIHQLFLQSTNSSNVVSSFAIHRTSRGNILLGKTHGESTILTCCWPNASRNKRTMQIGNSLDCLYITSLLRPKLRRTHNSHTHTLTNRWIYEPDQSEESWVVLNMTTQGRSQTTYTIIQDIFWNYSHNFGYLYMLI